MIGKTLGHYKITAKLGEGGMGVVYRAHDTNLNREVAVKILPAEMSGDPERAARFAREARTLASLQHANIAAIYGYEEHEDVRFLVMELVEGEDLHERLKRGAIPVDEAIDIANQIATGLETAHDKNMASSRSGVSNPSVKVSYTLSRVFRAPSSSSVPSFSFARRVAARSSDMRSSTAEDIS